MNNISQSRIIGLDILRVLLVILVFVFHSNMHFDCDYGIFNHFARMGAIAMTGFFMLSGYALSYSYPQVISDIKKVKSFMIKRLISLFPLYYIVSALFIVIYNKESIESLLLLLPIELLGLQSCFSSLFLVSHNGGTWFISCMMLCYLIFPFLQWIIDNISLRSKYILGGAIFVIMIISPIVQRHFHLASIYDNPFFRILEFMEGIIVASMSYKIQKKSISLKDIVWLLITITILIVGVGIGDVIAPRDFMLANWIVLPCFSVLLYIFGIIDIPVLHNSKILFYCSKLSYSFYLSQFFVWTVSPIILWHILCVDNNFMRIVVSFLSCIVISVFLHECVEKPASKWLRSKFV